MSDNPNVMAVVNALRGSSMPFPDNHNPNMDFINRWPSQLPPSGILNDLKPNLDPGLPMVRKLPGG